MKKIFIRKTNYIIAIAASVLFVTYLHYSAIERIHAIHDIYRELYYIPLLIGAIVFGLKGAVFTYLLIVVLYIPYIILNWTDSLLFEIKRIMFLLFSGGFSFLAGFLVDRGKEQQKQLLQNRYLAGIGQMAAGIVHDLKNPLISIIGFSQRIKDGKGNIDTAASTILDSARSMEKTVYEVLDFARPFELSLKEEDLRSVINSACNSCKAVADEKGVMILTNLPNEPLSIKIDSLQVKRTLVNLINNAVDASVSHQNISVSAIHEENSIVVKIRDGGKGMDKETIENIFTPFYTKKTGGTGLGVSMAKKIIEGHNGKININSQLGKGTEVIIKLPYKLKTDLLPRESRWT